MSQMDTLAMRQIRAYRLTVMGEGTKDHTSEVTTERRLQIGLLRNTDPAAPPIDLTRGSLEDRILAATLRCLGKWGTVKTTLDDIAREAGCSRATVYRTFPGGKDA